MPCRLATLMLLKQNTNMGKYFNKHKDEEIKEKVEGYLDQERNVFVVTSDPQGILSSSYNTQEKEEKEISDVREYLKKYRPNFK